MRTLIALVALWFSAVAALADSETDRLIDAMGMPALVRAFSSEGQTGGTALDEAFLNGQGGAVWTETVRKIYDPARLEAELRSGLAVALDPQVARTALIFFDSELGKKIITLEVQAREAMVDADIEAMARAAGADAGASVTDFLTLRDLTERNTDAALAAQQAFFTGMSDTASQPPDWPDFEGQRAAILAETDAWLRGYYALVQSGLSDEEIETYSAFWETKVGQAVDGAVFDVFGTSYTDLSYALGQAVGHLMAPREL